MKTPTILEEKRSPSHGDIGTRTGIVPIDYEGQAVQFNTDGWLHATEIAERFGKKPAHWLELTSTQSYMEVLGRALAGGGKVGFPDFGPFESKTDFRPELVKTKRGGKLPGTWLHPKLAVAFARRLSDEFAVWCDMRIDALLNTDPATRQKHRQACQVLDDRKNQASQGGSRLAHWRWDKSSLERSVTYWTEQLQLALELEES